MNQADESFRVLQVESPDLRSLFSAEMESGLGGRRLAIGAAAVANSYARGRSQRRCIKGYGDALHVPIFQGDLSMIAAQQQSGDLRTRQRLSIGRQEPTQSTVIMGAQRQKRLVGQRANDLGIGVQSGIGCQRMLWGFTAD